MRRSGPVAVERILGQLMVEMILIMNEDGVAATKFTLETGQDLAVIAVMPVSFEHEFNAFLESRGFKLPELLERGHTPKPAP